ncbi:ABC transporter, permease protein [Mycoplasmopsis alligatoris A21JP2]|uniref:ABC transporter, permease protein n=2 Tax=Mycoplasmopsis alligatoris TaxID=47687 RepID=D4XV18_9BACT|nr:ABC transporter, permease protein [Mycoplasmopsis alligatoris A21JP2]
MAMTMVFLWFSWLWLHKYFLDAINSIDPKFYFISLNNGNSKIYAFFQEIFLKLLSRFSSLFIYSFEANIRWGSILSALGLSGIGALIHFSGSADYTFDQIGIPLIILFIFIIFLEIISFLINKYLFEDQNIKITKFDYGTAVKVISLKKIIKNILFIVLIILSIVFLSTTNLSRTSLDKTHEFFLSTFSPDWSVFKFDNTLQNNPLLQILQSLYYALISLIVMLIFSFIIFYWSIFKLHGLKTSFTFKVFNTFIRLFPSVVFIYTFNPLANDPITLLVFVLGIHSSSSFSKRLYEITDTLDFEFIENLKIQSYSKFKIYIYYVIPTIKKDLITLSLFAFEMSFRSAITYAIFSANTLKIGSYINHYLNPIKYQPQKAMSYIWIATFSIFILNLLTDLIVKNLNNKKVRT